LNFFAELDKVKAMAGVFEFKVIPFRRRPIVPGKNPRSGFPFKRRRFGGELGGGFGGAFGGRSFSFAFAHVITINGNPNRLQNKLNIVFV